MGFESNWANTTDVVRAHYGKRDVDSRYGGEKTTSDHEKVVECVWDLGELITSVATSNDLTNPATGEMEIVVPAYAHVVSATAQVIEAISTTGGTAATAASLQVGLDKYSDGTAIDADGLIDATDGALTIASNDIAEPRGTILVGSNAALVPNIDIGADAGQIYAKLVIDDVTDMTAIAGKVKFQLTYIPEGV